MDIRIILGENHSILREGIRRILEKEPGFIVVGEVETEQELFDLFPDSSANIIILDSDIPLKKGIQTAKKLLEQAPLVKIILLSLHTEKYFVEETIKAGIYGYVLKNDVISEIVSAIQNVMAGKQYISPELTEYQQRLNR